MDYGLDELNFLERDREDEIEGLRHYTEEDIAFLEEFKEMAEQFT